MDPRDTVGDDAVEDCGGAVLIGANAIACVIDSTARVRDRATIEWRPLEASSAPDERLPWLPRALRDANREGRKVHCFFRAKDGAHQSLGEAHLSSYGGRYGHETATLTLAKTLSPNDAMALGHQPAPRDAMVGEELRVAIFEATDTAKRFALARRFAESWRGKLPHTPSVEGDMPAAVRAWHALYADVASVNELLACQPIDWSEEDAVHIFHCENQGVAAWGVREADLHLPDPPVVVRIDYEDWLDDAASVSAWALRFTISCEVFDCAGVSGWLDLSDEMQSVLERLSPTNLHDAHWPSWKTRVLVGPQTAVVVSGVDNEAGGQIQLAARDDEAFDQEVRRLGLADGSWEVCRR